MLLRPSRIAVAAPRRARVEIIPLIDVIFFLLATFVLFTLSLNRTQALPVVLPAGGGDPVHKPEMVTLQVTEGGAYWNLELFDLKELPARLAHYRASTEVPRVLITGDEKARFGPIVQVLDEVRKAGITSFSVETRTHPTGR
jgi:biopolymer transport protein ExbD